MKYFAFLVLLGFASAIPPLEYTGPQPLLGQIAQRIRQQQILNRIAQTGGVLGGIGPYGSATTTLAGLGPIGASVSLGGLGLGGGSVAKRILTQAQLFGGASGQTIAQQLSRVVGQKLEQAQVQNAAQSQQAGSIVATAGFRAAAAQELAQEITQDFLEAKKARIVEAIQELQQQLPLVQGASQTVGQEISQKAEAGGVIAAIEHLARRLQKVQQQEATGQSAAIQRLRETLQTVIEAQLTSEAVAIRGGGPASQVPGQNPTVFQTKIKKLISQFDIQEIKKEITKRQQSAQQLQQQQQFVSQQKQETQTQETLAAMQGASPQQVQELQRAQEALEQEEQELVRQQIGCSLVGQVLQEALTEEETNQQKQTVIEQIKEEASQVGPARLFV